VSNRERILVVDEISDTAEVLQAVLEPRGVTVNRICRWGQSEKTIAENRPAVVVFDAESAAYGDVSAGGKWHGVPQVILGTLRVAPLNHEESDGNGPAAPAVQRRYLQKPFQFAELVQAIEALIQSRAA
jgi:CheY-like chemotaxis protein